MLRFFGKDLHDGKYVCPTDLKAEHDRYVIKRAKADAQAELEKQLAKEDSFREQKGKFFGLAFSDGTISVRVLESIADIILEGKMMHHYAQYMVMRSICDNTLLTNKIKQIHCA